MTSSLTNVSGFLFFFLCNVKLKLCGVDNTSLVWKQLGVMRHMEEIAFFC